MLETHVKEITAPQTHCGAMQLIPCLEKILGHGSLEEVGFGFFKYLL